MNVLERMILKRELKKYLGKANTMKLSWNLVWQGLASVGQVANFVSGIIPAKDQPYVALVLAISQAAVAWRSHYFNPDGTPAASAYTKSK